MRACVWFVYLVCLLQRRASSIYVKLIERNQNKMTVFLKKKKILKFTCREQKLRVWCQNCFRSTILHVKIGNSHFTNATKVSVLNRFIHIPTWLFLNKQSKILLSKRSEILTVSFTKLIKIFFFFQVNLSDLILWCLKTTVSY